jgi:6-phosphofructokinase 2
MAAIVTLTMNPALDLSTATQALDPGHKTRCVLPERMPGGGGINVARALAVLGADVLALFPSGGPTGAICERLLGEQDVPQQTLPIGGEVRQNIALHVRDTDEVLHLVFPGPELDEREWQACLDAVATLEPVPELLVMSGSLPPGVPDDFYARAAQLAAERGSRVVLDTKEPLLRATLDAGAPLYLIKPNRKEARGLFEVAGDEPDDYLAALDGPLREGAAEAIVVTQGARGAVLASGELRVHLEPPASKGRAPVGAGDSYIAALVHRLAAGDGLLDAARDGVAAAAAAVRSRGELFRPEDLAALRGKIEVHERGGSR